MSKLQGKARRYGTQEELAALKDGLYRARIAGTQSSLKSGDYKKGNGAGAGVR